MHLPSKHIECCKKQRLIILLGSFSDTLLVVCILDMIDMSKLQSTNKVLLRLSSRIISLCFLQDSICFDGKCICSPGLYRMPLKFTIDIQQDR